MSAARPTPLALPPRFQSKIVIEPSGCWRWTGTLGKTGGYGSVSWRRPDGSKAMAYAHRVVYHLLVDSSFPPHLEKSRGTQVDHVAERCELRQPCVNPDHLEQVTPRENVVRATTNRHGLTGVDQIVGRRRCRARIYVAGERHYLGSHPDLFAAARAYDAACMLLGEEAPNLAAGLVGPPSPAEIADVRRRIYGLAKEQVA